MGIQIGDSELTGIYEDNTRLASWLDNLADQQKEALKDDLDEYANPEDLDENNLFNADEEYVVDQQDLLKQPWPKTTFSSHHDIQDDSSRTIGINNSKSLSIHSEIEEQLKEQKLAKLSQVKQFLENKFSKRIAHRYITNNYDQLKQAYNNDLQIESTAEYKPNEASMTRIDDAEIHIGKLESSKKEVKYTVDEVKSKAEEIIKETGKDVFKVLKNSFSEKLIKEAFPTNESFNKFKASIEKVEFDTIDHFAKQNILKTRSVKKTKEALVEKYGNKKTEAYLNQSKNIDKLSSFLNNNRTVIDNVDMQDNFKDINTLQANKLENKRAMYDDIESFIMAELLQKTSMEDLQSKLAKNYDESLLNNYFKNANIDKLSSFINRNDIKLIQRSSSNELNKNVKDLSGKEVKANIQEIKKEALQNLTKRASLESVSNSIANKYGDKIASELIDELKPLEHKLGYFYADSNCFNNCDDMTKFFNKNLKYAFLLKKKEACGDCRFNNLGTCTKTSLILSHNPLNISKRDGRKIIKAASEMKLLSGNIVNSYINDLKNGINNSPVIKSFLEDLKKAANLEISPSKKASSKREKTTGEEYRSVFDETSLNDFNVNSLNEDLKPFDINLMNLI